jgi:DNA-binding response OmpR family regulator
MTTDDAFHILVIDDDPALRELLAEYLTMNGLRVTVVGDGKAMRESLAKATPDAIVLDVMLPGEDAVSAHDGNRPYRISHPARRSH